MFPLVPLMFKHILSSMLFLMKCANNGYFRERLCASWCWFQKKLLNTHTPHGMLPFCLDLSRCTSISFHQEKASSGDRVLRGGSSLGTLSPSQLSTLHSFDFFFIYCYKIFITLSSSHPGKLRAVNPSYHYLLAGQ